MLTKDQILAASDLKRETVSVPEWGGDVYVRVMTGSERDQWEQSLLASKGATQPHMRASLCALCICNESGARLFADADIALLGGKSAAGLDRVFEVALRLNKIGANDVKELEGN